MKKMHYSVLLKESIDGLNIKDGGTYVDCTLGYAGHSKVILEKNKKGKLFAFDEDENAVKYSKEALSSIGDNFTIFKENFANLKETLEKENILNNNKDYQEYLSKLKVFNNTLLASSSLLIIPFFIPLLLTVEHAKTNSLPLNTSPTISLI